MANVVLSMHLMDGSKLAVRYPKQAGVDPSTIATSVKRALDAEKVVVEIDGDLLIVPVRNIKYFHVSPAPAHLPTGVIRYGRLIS